MVTVYNSYYESKIDYLSACSTLQTPVSQTTREFLTTTTGAPTATSTRTTTYSLTTSTGASTTTSDQTTTDSSTTSTGSTTNTSAQTPTDSLTTSTGVPTTTSCLLYTSPSPRDATLSRMPSSA